ncbi:MAG: elongation factor 1-beta [Aigarchaeota archaeon]|nr:elongation factor 1-beta [Aigarchaeota archaeon]MCS7117907.1 elongation factor 1-beta [Candidatus Calditenuaceae archaeon]MDW8041797.1 elongation factor 1-beta [Nitrososphaerota archaeon]
MGRVLYVVRVMPADDEVDLDQLLGSIKRSVPEEVLVRKAVREGVAFGLESLVIAFSLPEKEGITDELEEALRSVEGVGEVSVEALTREG